MSNYKGSARWKFVVLFSIFAMIVVACGGDAVEEETVVEEEVAEEAAPATTEAEVEEAVKEKVDVWVVIYQSSGIDVHTGVTGLAGMTKSIIAMDQIKKAKIPTFAVAARAVTGGTYASSFFQHEFLIVESNSVDNLLFSGKRVTANILKGTDQIPESFGTALGVKNSGLVDIVLENRNELKNAGDTNWILERLYDESAFFNGECISFKYTEIILLFLLSNIFNLPKDLIHFHNLKN